LNQPTHRASPLFTPVSIAFTVVFVIAFGIITWLLGGIGFSPGPVSAKSLPGVVMENYHSHADFESNCSLCHQPLKTSQAALCMQCHTDIASQVNTRTGLHGRLANADQCAACHAEHKGRNFDPTQAAILNFDHNLTGFQLSGKHGQIACNQCHTNNRYNQASAACVSCHQEPQVHTGMFGTDCQTCHSNVAWQAASFQGKVFDHASTNFSLALHATDYSGKAIACATCHQGDVTQSATQTQTCIACHGAHDNAFMQQHQATFGPQCMTCHDGKDRLHGFTHQAVFPLTGTHAALQCADCHANGRFRNTPATCSGCHREPPIHAGFFGLKCEYCHTTIAWQPALLTEHTFPLDHGGQGEVTCTTCHTGKYTAYTCYACHDHQPQAITASHASLNLTPERLAACTDCHLNGKVNR
jgi:hypothetical protein